MKAQLASARGLEEMKWRMGHDENYFKSRLLPIQYKQHHHVPFHGLQQGHCRVDKHTEKFHDLALQADVYEDERVLAKYQAGL